MGNKAPIVIFTYNRPSHIKQCIDSLKRNKIAQDSELFIFSDGAKGLDDAKCVELVRTFISSINGFKSIEIFIEEHNKGLANSVIQGVSKIFEKYDKIIVLEDDLVVSLDFLDYMNNALEFYKDNDRIFSISAYCAPIRINTNKYDIFFYSRINSWGWACWRNNWDSVDWELNDFNDFIVDTNKRKVFNSAGQDLTAMLLKYKLGLVDSWAIRFSYACFKQNKLNLYPAKSKVINLGIDNSGTNTKKSRRFDTMLDHQRVTFTDAVEEELSIKESYCKFLSPSLFRRLINNFLIKKYIRNMDRNH